MKAVLIAMLAGLSLGGSPIFAAVACPGDMPESDLDVYDC